MKLSNDNLEQAETRPEILESNSIPTTNTPGATDRSSWQIQVSDCDMPTKMDDDFIELPKVHIPPMKYDSFFHFVSEFSVHESWPETSDVDFAEDYEASSHISEQSYDNSPRFSPSAIAIACGVGSILAGLGVFALALATSGLGCVVLCIVAGICEAIGSSLLTNELASTI